MIRLNKYIADTGICTRREADRLIANGDIRVDGMQIKKLGSLVSRDAKVSCKGKISTFITRSSKNRQLMEVSISKGKKAITNYKTLEIFENNKTPTLSLVECKLETGRTHQIRVHMAYKGNNILGDKKYKKKFKKFKNVDPKLENLIYKLNRQFLHAKTLGFIHPKNGKEIKFDSILPEDLKNILKTLRNTNK